MTKPFKTNRRSFVAGATASAALAPFFIGTARAAEPEHTFKLATAAPRSSPWSVSVKEVKNEVKSKSKGALKIRSYLGSALGGELETLKATKRGRIQMWAGTAGALSSLIPEMGALECPYLFPSLKAADNAIDSMFDEIDDLLQKSNLKLLFASENGHRSIGINAGEGGSPIKKPADLVGKAMRAQQGFVHEKFWKAVGASPQPLPVIDVADALQRGVVVGFDNTPLFAFASGWYQSITHFTLTEHCYQPGFVAMNLDSWKSLTPAYQAIVLGDPKARAVSGRKGVRALKTGLINNFKNAGISVYKPTAAELAVWKAKTKGVHSAFTKKYGKGFYDGLKKNF